MPLIFVGVGDRLAVVASNMKPQRATDLKSFMKNNEE